MAQVGAVQGGQARKSKVPGEVGEHADALFIDEEGFFSAATRPQGQ